MVFFLLQEIRFLPWVVKRYYYFVDNFIKILLSIYRKKIFYITFENIY